MSNIQRFLVKTAPGGTRANLNIAGASVAFAVRPLFESIRPPHALGMAAAPAWHIVEAPFAFNAGNAWDVCHQILSNGLGFAGAPLPVYAEPDFEQQWVSRSPEDQALALSATCASVPQKLGDFPGDAQDNFWYRNPQHSQLAAALQRVQVPSVGRAVRIAHLDTGYDPEHGSIPSRLEIALQRNFADGNLESAEDSSSGFFNNLGHGTGTLSILAGQAVGERSQPGCIPFARVVPIRVANRVELFYTSAIAAALDYVHKLCEDPATAVDVVTMSMGGLASRAWADAVNALYEKGVVIVTAAGNNFGNLPTRNIVYPARFNRVIAACGVMADGQPYTDLPIKKMAGNYGPPRKMRTAMAAYTPNVPWAKFGCAQTTDFDGSGTSAATPQIAAAAALWLQQNRAQGDRYPEPWMRVEAVRKALFTSASAGVGPEKLGRGCLRAEAALSVVPQPAELQKEEPDSASFSLLRVLTGLGLRAPDNIEMLELEALQLSQSATVETILTEVPAEQEELNLGMRMRLAQALASHPRASQALRDALRDATAQTPPPRPVPPAQAPAGTGPGSAAPPGGEAPAPSSAPPPGPPPTAMSSMEALHIKQALNPEPPRPPGRKLRVYAYDPSLSRDIATVGLNQAILEVRWEPDLAPGPVGEYIEVVDIDPASGQCYAPVNLNDIRVLATNGLRPSESNPQFHQQMAYAVAMKTIEHFESALGRAALWSSRMVTLPPKAPGGPTQRHEEYVQRLRIYPHALRASNAYYSPDRKALLLGYFSGKSETGAPGEVVFSTLSHDIIAHETTHALLDGLHRRFREPTNPDVLAFHEAFSDIVALFQHFTLRESLRQLIVTVKGDLGQDSILAQLAVQFGQATGHGGGLRRAIGQLVDGKWVPATVSIKDYEAFQEPHARGAVLVSAVFDAFLRIYARRALDPIRLATNGSEVLPRGALSTHLADALTLLASKVAGHVLTMCIRALDYCPPVDITFGDYLRAILTADRDIVPDDPIGYRVAFVSAFSARGIFPKSLRTLSVETMVWEPPPVPFSNLRALFPKLTLTWDPNTDRRGAWDHARHNAVEFRGWLMDPAMVNDHELSILGLSRSPQPNYPLQTASGATVAVDMRGIEVHSVRPLRRVGPDGQFLSQLVVELTQSLHTKDGSGQVFRGGVTLILDLTKRQVSYMVRKRFDQQARVSAQQAMHAARVQTMSNPYAGVAVATAEPFAMLHRARS